MAKNREIKVVKKIPKAMKIRGEKNAKNLFDRDFYHSEENELGKGSYGFVYSVKQTQESNFRIMPSNHEYILKTSSSLVRFFINEYYIGRKLGNLLHIKNDDDYFANKPTEPCFVAKKFNKSLDKFLGENPNLTDRQRFKIDILAGRALKAIHDRGIYHSDIKTENVMINYTLLGNGEIHIISIDFIDFGGTPNNYDDEKFDAKNANLQTSSPEVLELSFLKKPGKIYNIDWRLHDVYAFPLLVKDIHEDIEKSNRYQIFMKLKDRKDFHKKYAEEIGAQAHESFTCFENHPDLKKHFEKMTLKNPQDRESDIPRSLDFLETERLKCIYKEKRDIEIAQAALVHAKACLEELEDIEKTNHKVGDNEFKQMNVLKKYAEKLTDHPIAITEFIEYLNYQALFFKDIDTKAKLMTEINKIQDNFSIQLSHLKKLFKQTDDQLNIDDPNNKYNNWVSYYDAKNKRFQWESDSPTELTEKQKGSIRRHRLWSELDYQIEKSTKYPLTLDRMVHLTNVYKDVNTRLKKETLSKVISEHKPLLSSTQTYLNKSIQKLNEFDKNSPLFDTLQEMLKILCQYSNRFRLLKKDYIHSANGLFRSLSPARNAQLQELEKQIETAFTAFGGLFDNLSSHTTEDDLKKSFQEIILKLFTDSSEMSKHIIFAHNQGFFAKVLGTKSRLATALNSNITSFTGIANVKKYYY